jgi:hypothetical protein
MLGALSPVADRTNADAQDTDETGHAFQTSANAYKL